MTLPTSADGDINVQLNRIRQIDHGGPRKHVTVLGAGMAGLATAHQL